MRLLSRKETQKRAFDTEEILRGKLDIIREEIIRGTKELNLIREKLKAENELAETELAVLREDKRKEKESLEQEVISLVARKTEALEPLDAVLEAIQARENDVRAAEHRNYLAASENDAQRLELAKGFEDLADRRIVIAEMEDAADRKLSGAEAQSLSVSEYAKAMNERFAKSALWVGKKTKELEDRKTILDVREAGLKTREDVVLLMRDENAKEKRKNESERAAINAAFNEARKKGIL